MQITDRRKDVIKSGGEWISSIDLENAAMAHDDVAEAAVIAIPHPKWDERPLLVVTPRAGCRPERDAADRASRRAIPEMDAARRGRLIDELPHTATGKVMKTRLREMFCGPVAARALISALASPSFGDDRHRPLRAVADRVSAYRRRAHRAVQLAVRAPSRRQLPAAHRGHRPGALDPRGGGGDHRRPRLARPRLGRRDRPPIRRAPRATPRSRGNCSPRAAPIIAIARPAELEAMREQGARRKALGAL